MNKILLPILLLCITFSATGAENESVDLKAFAQLYFNKMVATQSPDATGEDLENYLALLADDVGHTHLPWVTDDSRLPDGKQAMREGMTYYLGANTEYQAELLDVFIFNDSAIAIRYKHHAKGIHPQTQQPNEYTRINMEVLEMDGDKVGVIRKYHE
ncbi:MAG: hypothetical protein R3E90_09980 [Marinicella sp.]|nr:hypothetical protein [Xanthomonadales bacterium]